MAGNRPKRRSAGGRYRPTTPFPADVNPGSLQSGRHWTFFLPNRTRDIRLQAEIERVKSERQVLKSPPRALTIFEAHLFPGARSSVGMSATLTR